MTLSIGIVGLPNVGKSTLFNALTKKSVPAENYPFCTIDPSVGIVPVPDTRLYKLGELSHSAKIIPAVIEFVDIAGLVEGASKGEGLGNKFLSNIRETDAILQLVRIFHIEQPDGLHINHVYGSVDPLRDMKVIMMELILADLESITKREEKLGSDIKKGDAEAKKLKNVIDKIRPILESELPANTIELSEEENILANTLHLLTRKPIIVGINKRAGGSNLDETDPEQFKSFLDHIDSINAKYVIIDAKTEDDLKDFEGSEKDEMRKLVSEGSAYAQEGYGETKEAKDGIDILIKQSYDLLGLITYFTTGADETRAWTIKRGWTAPQAGTAIHTDFQTKFIRADVTACEDLLSLGSIAEARNKGKLRTEGKEYVVKDGDVIEFRI